MNLNPPELRELLERVLPLERLVPSRTRPDRHDANRVSREIHEAGRMVLERFGISGLGPPMVEIDPTGPSASVAAAPFVDRPRSSPIGSTPTIERDGIQIHPRGALPTRASADLNQVRRLLNMEDIGLLADPRSNQARDVLHQHLGQAGLELIGTSDLRLLPLSGEESEGPGRPFDAELARRALIQPELLFYCPDLACTQPLADPAREGAVASLVVVAITSADQTPLALLEVRSARTHPFEPEDLARIDLLADFCASALERAARLEKLVFVDSMTGVYNRPYFELQARNEIARALREQASVGLCIVDIDDFKATNTAYGYEAGNEVLTQVASTLRRGVRPFDTVARWGGEEFAVLLTPPANLDDVAAICERLRSAVERLRFSVEGLDQRLYDVRVSVSMGVAVFPDHGGNSADLWRAANQALLVAKRPPKNQVVFFTP